MDVFSQAVRSRIMSSIKSSSTHPEMLIRRFLFSFGYRYRINDRRYPGRPDIVLPRYKAAIFVNGCFWHGHDCPLFHEVKSNREYWREKIRQNRMRDERNHRQMAEKGFRVIVVWECAIRLNKEIPSFLLSLEEEIREGTNSYVEFGYSE